MTGKLKGIPIAAAAIAVLAVGGAAIATAAGESDDGTPSDAAVEATGNATVENEGDAEEEGDGSEAAERASGSEADAAAQAAIDAVGGGSVLEVEHADDGMNGYEVEVERPDGSYLEVNLDEGLEVVSTGGDD